MFDFVEEAFDEIAVSIEIRAEGRDVDAVAHRFDVGPCASLGQGLSQRVAVIGSIGQKGLSFDQRVEHVAGAVAVMGLALGQLERDRQALGVDRRMDLVVRPPRERPMQLDRPSFFWRSRHADARGCWTN